MLPKHPCNSKEDASRLGARLSALELQIRALPEDGEMGQRIPLEKEAAELQDALERFAEREAFIADLRARNRRA